MEIWRVGYGEERLPAVISGRTLAIALVIHLAFFVVFWIFAVCHGLFDPKEEIIPIDLTVVVNENLKGKENEPPPLKKSEPEKPKPKPKPQPKKVKEPEKPKELEKIVTNIVAKVDRKDEKKEPKKTAKELREEKIAKMRASAKQVNTKVMIEVPNAKDDGDGRTDKKILSEAEIRRRLLAGYKAGTSNQLAASDEQLGFSLIKMAFEEKWEKPPWTSELRPMVIRVWFGGGGTISKWRLELSSGDARADQSIKSAALRVGSVPGLPPAFIDKYRRGGVPVRFTVKPQ